MENLFDVLNNKMFSVFARKDKRTNYDLLSKIYDIFTKDEHCQSMIKDELTEKLAAYIKSQNYDDFVDDEDRDLNGKTFKDKATIKLRQFRRCGWLEEENTDGFDIDVSITDNAIMLLETFQSIISKRERPIEYTGYFYLIYDILNNFDYKDSKALLEQIVKNTTELFNRLQGLHSEIKRYIGKLLNRADLTPHAVLDLLLNKYQDQVILNAFNNLQGRDNPSKYTSEILKKLNDIRYAHLDEIVKNHIATANIKNATNEQIVSLKAQLAEDLDSVIVKFENVNTFVSVIDRKNRKFHSSALATLNFLMNNRNDIEGQVDKALRALRDVNEKCFDNTESVIDIYSNKNLDENSLFSRTFNKSQKTALPIIVPEVTEEELTEAEDSIFGKDEYSKEEINNYVLSLLGNKDKINSLNIQISEMADMINLIMLQIYSEYESMVYDLNYLPHQQTTLGYTMQSFEIIRRK